MNTRFTLDAPLRAAGELLQRRGESAAIVVVGGTALNLLGVVDRATRDVDVIALGQLGADLPPVELQPPDPPPDALLQVIQLVARDFGLDVDWMNWDVALQWKTGLPPGFETRIEWREYSGLWVGLADRLDLIFLKLYAAVDDVGPNSPHYTDLLALKPTEEELQAAASWIKTQDPSPAIEQALGEVVRHVTEASC
jgi:hypothetical protein